MHRRLLFLYVGLLFIGAGCYRPPTSSSELAMQSGPRPADCGSPTAPAQAYFTITPNPVIEGEWFTVNAECTTGVVTGVTFSVEPAQQVTITSPVISTLRDDPSSTPVKLSTDMVIKDAGEYVVTLKVQYEEGEEQVSLPIIVAPKLEQRADDVVIGPGQPPERCGQRLGSDRKALGLLGYVQTSNLRPVVGETITFDAGCSVGDIVKVEWDVDMVECLDRKSPGLRARTTEENPNSEEVNRALESCFERVFDVRNQQLGNNKFPAMVQTYVPPKPGTTRARVRLTDRNGRREVKQLVYTVRLGTTAQHVDTIVPRFSLEHVYMTRHFQAFAGASRRPGGVGYMRGTMYSGSQPIPTYDDTRVAFVSWPKDTIRINRTLADVSAVSTTLRATIETSLGNAQEMSWLVVGQTSGFAGKPVLLETPWQPVRQIGQNNQPIPYNLTIPAPTARLFLEERTRAYANPVGHDPATPPTLDQLRFSSVFPYTVEVTLRLRDGSKKEYSTTKLVRFLSPWENADFKTELLFSPDTTRLPSSGDYVSQASAVPALGLVGITNIQLSTRLSSLFVLDPEQQVRLGDYTVVPYGLADEYGYDNFDTFNQTTGFGRHWSGTWPHPKPLWETVGLRKEFVTGNVSKGINGTVPPTWTHSKDEVVVNVPKQPGTYHAQVKVRADNGQEVIDEVAYRVRQPIALDIMQAPQRQGQVGQTITFGARASKGEILTGRWIITSQGALVYDSKDQPWDRDGGLLQYKFNAPGRYTITLVVTEAETYRIAAKEFDYTIGGTAIPPVPTTSVLYITEKGVANVYDQRNLTFDHGALLFISIEDTVWSQNPGRVEWDFNNDGNFTDEKCTVTPRSPCNTVETQALGACPNNGACVIRVRLFDPAGKLVQEGQGSYRLTSSGSQRAMTDYEKSVLCPPESERQPGYLYEC